MSASQLICRLAIPILFIAAGVSTVGCSNDISPESADAGLTSDAADAAGIDASDHDASHHDAAERDADVSDVDQPDGESSTDIGSDADSGDVATPLPLQQATSAFFEAYCEATFSCFDRAAGHDHLARHMRRYATLADCKAAAPQLAATFGDFPYLVDAVAEGRLVYDAAESARFVDSIVARVCAGRQEDGFPRSVLAPGRAAGEPCLLSRECPSAFACEPVQGQCYGTCQRKSGSCGGVTCAYGTEYCDGGQCVPAKSVGQSCSAYRECSRPDDLTCYDPDGDGQGTCEPAHAQPAGSPCGDGLWCQAGLFCDRGTCRAPLGEGATCIDSGACDPAQGLSCNNLENVCVLNGSRALNQSCNQDVHCQSGLVCHWDQRVCVDARSAQGESCNIIHRRCEIGLGCQDLDMSAGVGTCAAFRAQGESCQFWPQCQLGLTCDAGSGTCQPQFADGQSCSGDWDCRSLNCDGGVCAPLRACAVPAP
jgi:hypothetical protein